MRSRCSLSRVKQQATRTIKGSSHRCSPRYKLLDASRSFSTLTPSNYSRTVHRTSFTPLKKHSTPFNYSLRSHLSTIKDKAQQKTLEEVTQVIDILTKQMEKENVLKRLEVLDTEVKDENIWQDSKRASKLMKEQAQLRRVVDNRLKLVNGISDFKTLFELATSEEDECYAEAVSILEATNKAAQEMEMLILMSKEADSGDCFVDIQPGAGGTESMDWASMLMSMYRKWAARRGYEVEIIELSDGEVAGIKSACFKIRGSEFAYGWMKNETGVHRLIRISPFDANARRHTSFASVFVSPVVDDSINITIDKNDLRIDTYRSSGGQHVNKTDSAVRITHIPTGIVAKAQSERSQHRNKDIAMDILKARLYALEEQKRQANTTLAKDVVGDIGFGNQMRTYTLQPYRLIKDSRTGMECNNPDAVLNGGEELDEFMKAALSFAAKQ